MGSGWSRINVKKSDVDIIFIPVFIDPYKTEKSILFIEGTDTLLAHNPGSDKFKIPISDNKTIKEAIEWQQTRGARSGRVAWQFIIFLAGKHEVLL